MKRILVVGGGPAGMMAALSARLHHPYAEVILFERNARLGLKLLMTGGGRCNVSCRLTPEVFIQAMPKHGRFLYSALHQFGPKEIEDFFVNEGCPLIEEDHHRLFPSSGKSITILKALENALIKQGVKIELNASVEKWDDKGLWVNQKLIKADTVILANGGKVLPQTGSDGNGYQLATQAGHSITELYPAEVPLVSNDEFIQNKVLQGISVNDVEMTIPTQHKKGKKLCHHILFTHFGLSGPLALQSSTEVRQALQRNSGPVSLILDFAPGIEDETEIEKRLPKRLRQFIDERARTENVSVHYFPVSVYETQGFKHAFVTDGGVSLKEIDAKTMRSKLNPKLSVCGELLDLNGYTGGYNITIALSTGYAAGKYALGDES